MEIILLTYFFSILLQITLVKNTPQLEIQKRFIIMRHVKTTMQQYHNILHDPILLIRPDRARTGEFYVTLLSLKPWHLTNDGPHDAYMRHRNE